ncbi:unnamed protein product [Nesidiocoris tenuis]|uniref:Uncharacterized protein n=1 Tax=Nesidiocoris tenuis TaxID=355587 RepID=A0A6H5GXD3_9HEMI|nr:unnamed protein product [Nesidiocoris tenuis]
MLLIGEACRQEIPHPACCKHRIGPQMCPKDCHCPVFRRPLSPKTFSLFNVAYSLVALFVDTCPTATKEREICAASVNAVRHGKYNPSRRNYVMTSSKRKHVLNRNGG